jgi:2',3'-cyclic-nucleotide 2'-phosphodiesterase (5'-nucleotidase family)
VAFGSYDVKPDRTDSSIQAMLRPYQQAVGASMEAVLAEVAAPLPKSQPDNVLGYFMTDAFLVQAAKVFGQQPDIALMNQGGIRINNLPAGPLKMRQLYELMPFDNQLVIIELTGDQLQALLNHVAARGGWAISGGTYQIRNKQAVNVQIGNQALQSTARYRVALSDYIANGGDDCAMLVGVPQKNQGYLQRDALIDYVKELSATGKQVQPPAAGRVTLLTQ